MDYSKINHLIDSVEQIDLDAIMFLDIHWRYGTFRPYSTGSGRDKKHFSRSGVATPIGDIQEDLWYQVAEYIAKRENEEWLVDALTQWNKDNHQWVCYVPFNRQFRPEVLENARIVTIVSDCCQIPGEVTQAQIDRAQKGQVCCPHCGRWSTFSILSEESPPWDEF